MWKEEKQYLRDALKEDVQLVLEENGVGELQENAEGHLWTTTNRRPQAAGSP
jgi:hypothetical protein